MARRPHPIAGAALAALLALGCGSPPSPHETGLIGTWSVHLEADDGTSLQLDTVYTPDHRLRLVSRLSDAAGREILQNAEGWWTLSDDELTTDIDASENPDLLPTGTSTRTIESMSYEELVLSSGSRRMVYQRSF